MTGTHPSARMLPGRLTGCLPVGLADRLGRIADDMERNNDEWHRSERAVGSDLEALHPGGAGRARLEAKIAHTGTMVGVTPDLFLRVKSESESEPAEAKREVSEENQVMEDAVDADNSNSGCDGPGF